MKVNRLSLVLALAVAGSSAACDDEGGPRHVPDLENRAKFVVRHSDFSSTSFSLLDAQGDVLVDDYVNSGTVKPGLTALLSGDVDVPTLGEHGVLTAIDRFGADVITRIDLSTDAVIGQVRTQGAVTNGFSGNPQDLAVISATSGWVSRYNENAMVDAAADVRGSDLIEIDPATMTLTGASVDLRSFAVDVEVQGESGPVTLRAQPRPRRLVQVGDYLAVGLDLLTGGYEGAAPGKLAVVDLGTHAVTSFDLGGLTNCGNLSRVPGHADYVAIVCQGFLDRATESGLIVVSIDGAGVVTEVRRYESGDYPDDAYLFDAIAMIDEDELVGVHVGGYLPSDPADTLVHLSLASGARTPILTAGAASGFFVTMAFDPATGLLLVPEHGVGIHRFTRGAGGAFTAGTDVTLVGHGLDAVAVSLLP